jgi:tetratricopeptide (TPR) repeat protein
MQYGHVMAPNVLDDDQLASGLRADGIAGVISSGITTFIGWFVAEFIPSIGAATGASIGMMIGALSYIFFAITRNKKRAVQLEMNKQLRMEMAVQFSSTLSDIDDSSKLQEWNKIKLEIASSILTESNQRILERELIVKYTISETVNVSGVAEEKYGELYAKTLELEKNLEMVEREHDETRKKLLAQKSVDLAEEMKSNGFQFTAKQLIEIGYSALKSGNLDIGVGYALQASKISTNQKEHSTKANCLRLLGMIEGFRRNDIEAEGMFRESLAICREIEDREGEVKSLNELGSLLLNKNIHQAELLYKESLAICREINDKSEEAVVIHNIGGVAVLRGDLEKAGRLYKESCDINIEIGVKPSPAAIHQLGFVEEKKGNFDEATILYQESLTISIENGNRHTQATTMSQLAYLEMKHNRNLDEAERLYQKVLDLELELGRTKDAENARKNLDYVRLFLDNLDDPEQLKKKILALQGEDAMFDEEE